MQLRLLFPAALLLLVGGLFARGEAWPKDYVVPDFTTSPNGRYGLLVPPNPQDYDDEGAKNFLVEIPSHRVLGKLAVANYIQGRNHRSLQVTWAPDSTWCVVCVNDRLSFDSITGVEIIKGGLHETTLGPKIDEAVAAAVTRHSHGRTTGAGSSVYFRAGADRKVCVRALATDDPKE